MDVEESVEAIRGEAVLEMKDFGKSVHRFNEVRRSGRAWHFRVQRGVSKWTEV